jgi:RNA polymerase sigma-70 factor (ECF subfamily)
MRIGRVSESGSPQLSTSSCGGAISNEDDGSLLRDGERRVGQLYDRHSRAVFRLAYALLRDPDDARDIVQDTFGLAWRKRHTITLLNGSALPWLLATARLTALAARRRRDHRASRSVKLDRAADVSMPTSGDADAVRQALDGLPEPDRRVLTFVPSGRSWRRMRTLIQASRPARTPIRPITSGAPAPVPCRMRRRG